ncbi:MAG: nuclear transport factor 2 family protein, partial [Acidobacteriota bacterium]|nr:nuclear transport factor 2 family protein [Acidobacteriota bacterium]
PPGPEAVAHAREDAFNRHDLSALAALYAPDARIFEPPDRLRETGSPSIREAYARSFSMAPDARVRVTETMTEGNLTVVRETSTRAGTTRSSIRVLEVRDGRIAVEWILR